MCRVKSDLLNLSKIILDVLVQSKLSDLAERELILGPDVREIEDVDALLLPDLFGLLSCHGLYLDIPAWEISLLNRLEQVFGGKIGAIAEGIFLGDEVGTLL
jgi:hypothetical protein